MNIRKALSSITSFFLGGSSSSEVPGLTMRTPKTARQNRARAASKRARVARRQGRR